jgi:hypothetical protein
MKKENSEKVKKREDGKIRYEEAKLKEMNKR